MMLVSLTHPQDTLTNPEQTATYTLTQTDTNNRELGLADPQFDQHLLVLCGLTVM